MKYINREYGFTFRPPFFDKFYEESPKGPQVGEENFPGKNSVGAGYDYAAINGAMLIGKNGTLWGVKISYFNGRKWLDNDDFTQKMGVGCANTSDGSFAHFSSGPLSVKWVKHSGQSLAFQVSARKRLRVRVIFYPACRWPADLSIEGSYVKGRSSHVGIIPGTIKLSDACAVYRGRYQVIMDEKQGREYFYAQSYSKPSDTANGAFNEAIMEFIISKNQPSVYLFAIVGDESIFAADAPRQDKIAKLIETNELRYGVNTTGGSGILGGTAETMLNSIMWSRIYYPYLMESLYSPRRSALNEHFDISGLEENCAALLGSYAGEVSLALNQLRFTGEDKVMACLTAWHIVARSADRSIIAPLYEKFSALYPPDGRLTISNEQDAKNLIAYKQTDSPLKETYDTLEMYSLDVSCLKLLAFDILERIALENDFKGAYEYGVAKQRLKSGINEVFWNDTAGLYMNRYVTGQWAHNYGATSFYPLIAGAVDDVDRLNKLINTLTDPRRFWGNYPIPTLSRDNKQYGRRGKPNNSGVRARPYLEYRGSVVPYINYLIYHGLRRVGLDEIAGELAYKSVMLWRNNVSANVENYSMYLPSGRRVKYREYLSNNGNMLALMGLQELIDVESFRDDLKPALRFGTFVKGSHSLTNLKMLGRSFSIDVSPLSTMLLVDNQSVFLAEGGRCVVRHFITRSKACDFIIDAHSPLEITLDLSFAGEKSQPLFFKVPAGKSRVSAEGGTVKLQIINL